ncbi:MAG: hypothetical protein ACRC62_02795 [Microcoleus sp.]
MSKEEGQRMLQRMLRINYCICVMVHAKLARGVTDVAADVAD